jgi:hypothetical protein
MQRFDESGDGAPKHAGVVEDMLRAARAAIPADAAEYAVERCRSDGFEVALVAGTGTVYAEHAAFQLQDLREPDLRVVHAIASAGDMTIIIEGGPYKVILTDPKQLDRLPDGWAEASDPTPIAATVAQFVQLLRSVFDGHELYRQKVVGLYAEAGPADPSPWTTGDPEHRIIYIESRNRERAITQQNRLFKFYDKTVVPERNGMYVEGSCGGFSWVVELPSGEQFYGFRTRGDHDGWMRVFKAFVAVEDRLIGTIEGGESGKGRFVCDDGRIFPLSECTCKVLTED